MPTKAFKEYSPNRQTIVCLFICFYKVMEMLRSAQRIPYRIPIYLYYIFVFLIFQLTTNNNRFVRSILIKSAMDAAYIIVKFVAVSIQPIITQRTPFFTSFRLIFVLLLLLICKSVAAEYINRIFLIASHCFSLLVHRINDHKYCNAQRGGHECTLSLALANIDIFGVFSLFLFCNFFQLFLFLLLLCPDGVKERQPDQMKRKKIGHPAGPEFTSEHHTSRVLSDHCSAVFGWLNEDRTIRSFVYVESTITSPFNHICCLIRALKYIYV